jgi:hypothetical protein
MVYSVQVSSEFERLANIAVLLSSYRGKSLTDEIAVSKMLTILFLAIPDIEKYLVSNGAPILTTSITSADCLDKLAEQRGPAEEEPSEWGSPEVNPDCVAVTNSKAIYAAAAVAFTTYAKSAGESSRNALEAARPSAMAGKYGLDGHDLSLFPGADCGPILENLEQVNIGFTMYPGLRYLITAYFISIQSQGSFVPPNLDPFLMIFALLKNQGMTHVGAIVKLIEMAPWVLRVPQLVPDLRAYASDLQLMAKVPEEYRPYHRLLVPQSQYLFVSSNLRPLIAVAGEFVKEVEVTFKDYVFGASNYAELITEVKSRAPMSATVPDIQRLAALFGVPDVEPGPSTSKRSNPDVTV